MHNAYFWCDKKGGLPILKHRLRILILKIPGYKYENPRIAMESDEDTLWICMEMEIDES